MNMFWKPVELQLPELPAPYCWYPAVDTFRGAEAVIRKEELLADRRYVLQPRSVCVFLVKER